MPIVVDKERKRSEILEAAMLVFARKGFHRSKMEEVAAAAKIGKVAAPVLIVHGERDRTIPVRLARKLHKRAREPKEAVFIPDADHADLPEFGLPTYVLEFLARHGLVPKEQ